MSASSIVEFEQETINNANALLAHVGISSKRVSTSAELGRVGSSMFVAIYEALFQVRLDGIIRTPQTKMDYAYNAELLVAALSVEIDMDLHHISGEAIAEGDQKSLSYLVDILYRIASIQQKGTQVSSNDSSAGSTITSVDLQEGDETEAEGDGMMGDSLLGAHSDAGLSDTSSSSLRPKGAGMANDYSSRPSFDLMHRSTPSKSRASLTRPLNRSAASNTSSDFGEKDINRRSNGRAIKTKVPSSPYLATASMASHAGASSRRINDYHNVAMVKHLQTHSAMFGDELRKSIEKSDKLLACHNRIENARKRREYFLQTRQKQQNTSNRRRAETSRQICQQRWAEDLNREASSFEKRLHNQDEVLFRKTSKSLLKQLHQWHRDEQNELRDAQETMNRETKWHIESLQSVFNERVALMHEQEQELKHLTNNEPSVQRRLSENVEKAYSSKINKRLSQHQSMLQQARLKKLLASREEFNRMSTLASLV